MSLTAEYIYSYSVYCIYIWSHICHQGPRELVIIIMFENIYEGFNTQSVIEIIYGNICGESNIKLVISLSLQEQNSDFQGLPLTMVTHVLPGLALRKIE